MVYTTDKLFNKADANINNSYNAHLNFLRNDIVKQKWISKEDMDTYINSILSDDICKNKITEGYKMKDADKKDDDFYIETLGYIPEVIKSLPSYWIESQEQKENLKNIQNIRKWFLKQKENYSYKRHPKYKNKEEFENSYKDKISKFDTRDVALNQILEFSFRSLLKDILDEMKGKNGITDVQVIKTNEYDDVCSKSDYIIKFIYPNAISYQAIDITTSTNLQNLEDKKKLKNIICPDFHFNEKINFSIPRSVFVIEDKKVLFKYLEKYMQQVKITGNVEPKQALGFLESIGSGKEIKKQVLYQLLKNLSQN